MGSDLASTARGPYTANSTEFLYACRSVEVSANHGVTGAAAAAARRRAPAGPLHLRPGGRGRGAGRGAGGPGGGAGMGRLVDRQCHSVGCPQPSGEEPSREKAGACIRVYKLPPAAYSGPGRDSSEDT